LSVDDSILYGFVPVTAKDTSFSLLVSDGELNDSINVNIIIHEQSSVSTMKTPNHFQISNNYPNPFNLTTNIKIELPEKTNLELFVYDLKGKIVKEIYKGQLNAGIYIYDFDATNLSSGIYIIKFKSDKYNQNTKCTLLK
jgi:hypothetical protein